MTQENNFYEIGGYRNGVVDYMGITAKTEDAALIQAGKKFRAWAKDIKRDVPQLAVSATNDKFEVASINDENVSPKRFYSYEGKDTYKLTDWRDSEDEETATKKNKPFNLDWTIRKETVDELCIRKDDPNIAGLGIHQIDNKNAGDNYSHTIIAKAYENIDDRGLGVGEPIFTIIADTTHDGSEHSASGGVYVQYKNEKTYREELGSEFTKQPPWTEEILSGIEEKKLRDAIEVCDSLYPKMVEKS